MTEENKIVPEAKKPAQAKEQTARKDAPEKKEQTMTSQTKVKPRQTSELPGGIKREDF